MTLLKVVNEKRRLYMSGEDNNDIDFGVLDELIGYRLRKTQLVFFNRFGDACADVGISPGLFGVLVIVKRNPGLTQTAVAMALGNDRSAMVAAVDKLEQMNLVERRPSKSDRRSYALYLTEEGETRYQSIEERVLEHERELQSVLKPGEQELLLDMLMRLTQSGIQS